MKDLKKGISIILALLLSCTAFVGCTKNEKEEIPSMASEPEKWEIEVRPGHFGRTDGLEFELVPKMEIADLYIPESEIDYVKKSYFLCKQDGVGQSVDYLSVL